MRARRNTRPMKRLLVLPRFASLIHRVTHMEQAPTGGAITVVMLDGTSVQVESSDNIHADNFDPQPTIERAFYMTGGA